MNGETLAACIVIAILVIAFMHGGARPSKKDYSPSEVALPAFHWNKGKDDGDARIDLVDEAGKPTGSMLLDNGVLYDPKDGKVRGTVTRQLYATSVGLDLGTFAGYRDAARGSNSDTFSVGLRYSPVRVFYGCLAPDLAVTKDWGGVGLSLYLPDTFKGQAISHFGLGAWYGSPFGGRDAGDAGWTVGLSFSSRN